MKKTSLIALIVSLLLIGTSCAAISDIASLSQMNQAPLSTVISSVPLTQVMGIKAGFVTVAASDTGVYNDCAASLGNSPYLNGIAYISAGINLENSSFLAGFLPNRGKDVLLGVNIKLLVGCDLAAGKPQALNSDGFNADIGFLYSHSEWLSVGINQKNVLPSSVSDTSSKRDAENAPSLTNLGGIITVMGPKGLIKSLQTLKVSLNTDLSLMGIAGHANASYAPIEWLSLNCGVDQLATPDGIATKPLVGLGFEYEGLCFEYSYQTSLNLADSPAHTFSISIGGK